MNYVDLRPYKPKEKKKEEAASETAASSSNATLEHADFLANLAEAGKEEVSGAAQKADMIEILNLLHEKISNIEERLFRIERKLDED